MITFRISDTWRFLKRSRSKAEPLSFGLLNIKKLLENPILFQTWGI